MSIATGAAEKAISQIYENVFRPAEKRHEPWVQRCREQTEGALAELDRVCAALPKNGWLLGRAHESGGYHRGLCVHVHP